MSDIVIKIDDVYKQYRLGAIGGGMLRGDLQSAWARLWHKEEPEFKKSVKADTTEMKIYGT